MMAPKTQAHAREFGDNFFFIKKGGSKPQPLQKEPIDRQRISQALPSSASSRK